MTVLTLDYFLIISTIVIMGAALYLMITDKH